MNLFKCYLLLSIACSSLVALVAKAAPALPPFYVAASQMKPEGKLGQVVKKEKVATEIPGAQAWRIAYISSNVNDLKTISTGLLISPVGRAAGPHCHPWDESFFVHHGVDGVEALVQAGIFIHVPGGSTHWFKFGDGGAAMISMTPQGNASKMFTDFAHGISWDNPDPEKLIELAAQYG